MFKTLYLRSLWEWCERFSGGLLRTGRRLDYALGIVIL